MYVNQHTYVYLLLAKYPTKDPRYDRTPAYAHIAAYVCKTARTYAHTHKLYVHLSKDFVRMYTSI